MIRWLRRVNPDLPDYLRVYLGAPAPDPQLHWRETEFAVIDIETSGLDSNRDVLLAIGLVTVERGRIQLCQRWQSLVRPPAGAPVGAEAICVHGLMPEDTAGAPPLDNVLPDFLGLISGRVLVVHVASIDIAFLNRAMRATYGMPLRGPAIDTARIAAGLYREDELIGETRGRPLNIQLAALCAQYGLPIHAEHDALGDALSTAQLFLAQATRLEQRGRTSLRELLRAGQCLR